MMSSNYQMKALHFIIDAYIIMKLNQLQMNNWKNDIFVEFTFRGYYYPEKKDKPVFRYFLMNYYCCWFELKIFFLTSYNI